METTIFQKQQERFFSGEVVLGFLLPPILGVPFLFFNYIRNKKSQLLISFLIVYTLICLYFFPNYDPNIFFWDAISDDFYYQGHVGNLVANIIRQFFHIDVYFTFGVYFFLSIFFNFKALDFYSGHKRTDLLFVIAILSLPINAWTNTFYFTFAVAFVLCFCEKYKSSTVLFVLSTLISVLIHSGISLVIFPAIIIYMLAKKNKFFLFCCFLVIYLIGMWFFFHGYAEQISSIMGDSEIITDKIQRYTDNEGVWGGVGLKKGIIGRISQIFSYLLFAYTLLMVYINRKKMKCHFVTYMLIIGCINLLCSFQLYTFNQRFCILNIMLSVAVFCVLYQNGRAFIYKSYIVATLLLLYVPFFWHYPHQVNDLFDSKESYSNISTQIFYVPSFLLVTNFSNMGWNDNYMYQHAIYYRNYYYYSDKKLKYVW